MVAPVLVTAARLAPMIGTGAVIAPTVPVLLAGAAAIGFVVWVSGKAGVSPYYKKADGSEFGLRQTA